jgi:hypothetical protein
MLHIGLQLALVLAAADAGAAVSDAGAPPLANAPPVRSLLAPIATDRRPPPPRQEYQLRRLKNGTGDLMYESPAWKARVARDGSVSFHDKHISIDLAPWFFRPKVFRPPIMGVPSLQTALRGAAPLPPPPPPEVQEQSAVNYNAGLPVPAMTPYRPDPSEACQYPRPCFFQAELVLLDVSGIADVTDELIRLSGQDPYRFAKARFLLGTRELRIRLAARAHADDLRNSTAELPHLLTTIACNDRLSPRDRRAIIEALRQELDTATPEARAADHVIERFLTDLDRPNADSICPPR